MNFRLLFLLVFLRHTTMFCGVHAITKESSMQELTRFAKGFLSGYQAVENASTVPWSNGQVEGEINKLKNLKRQIGRFFPVYGSKMKNQT